MKSVTGDLLDLAEAGHFDVIMHGANCHCAMGRGIALTIKNRYPEVYAADCATVKSDRNKLGTVSTQKVRAHEFIVANCYTQFDYYGNGVLADYDAIRACAREVKKRFAGQRIGYPKIGAGLAKGDWNVIKAILEEEFEGEDHTLVIWNKQR
jgi:O-acetyl-ADP-ribose deacetylase (regulator of RNase III)